VWFGYDAAKLYFSTEKHKYFFHFLYRRTRYFAVCKVFRTNKDKMRDKKKYRNTNPFS
jgi:hypothetical protein